MISTDDIVVKTAKPGYLEQDSSAQFVVSNTPATITINGTYWELPKGAIVRFVAGSDQQGDITIDSNRILKFAFPDMAVYVNGDLIDQGTIGSIYIPSMAQFQTESHVLLPAQISPDLRGYQGAAVSFRSGQCLDPNLQPWFERTGITLPDIRDKLNLY